MKIAENIEKLIDLVGILKDYEMVKGAGVEITVEDYLKVVMAMKTVMDAILKECKEALDE